MQYRQIMTGEWKVLTKYTIVDRLERSLNKTASATEGQLKNLSGGSFCRRKTRANKRVA